MKSFHKTVDYQFLVRVIKNEVGPEEKEFFQKWLEESEANKEEFSSFLLLWDKFSYSRTPSLPPQEIQWEKIDSAISANKKFSPESTDLFIPRYKNSDSGTAHRRNSNSASPVLTWFLRVAALLIIGVPLFLLMQKEEPKQGTGVLQSAPAVKYYSVSTENGEKATLTLSDGSVINLNSASKLKYPNYFGSSSREVEFEGEAYFKINPDKSRPFRVKCNNTVTEVTGTEFNIRNRDNKISITVVEGSVKTFSSKSPEGVAVVKGEMVTLKNSGSFSKPHKVNLQNFTAWRENKLSFSRTPLTAAADEIERCFSNIDIRILSDSLRQRTITGVFNTGSLDEILSVLSLTLDIKISKKGHQIYFE